MRPPRRPGPAAAARGTRFLDAARASLADCAEELGLAGHARECAAVALDALHAALGDAAERALALPLAARPGRRRDVGRRRFRRRAAARARRQRRCRRPHAEALDRRAGAGRRARLLLAGGRPAGAGELPRARASARHAGRPGGLPPGRRRAVRGGLRARRDAESVHDLQRLLPPGGARRRRTSGSGRVTWRPGTTRGSSSATGGRSSAAVPMRPRISRTCWRACRRRCWSGCDCPWATRRRPPCGPRRPRPGWLPRPRARARTSASSAAGRSTTSSRARACNWTPAASATRPGMNWGATRGRRPTRRASAGVSASRRRRSSTCCVPMLRATSSSWARGAVWPAARSG